MAAESTTAMNTAPAAIKNVIKDVNIDLRLSAAKGTMQANVAGERAELFHTTSSL